MFSQSFLIALKLNKLPQYLLAQKSGLNPSLLSKWVCGIQKPTRTDPRLKELAKILGLVPDEIFTAIEETKGQLRKPVNTDDEHSHEK